MRRLNLNLRLPLALSLAALLCGASLRATAQTTTTTPAAKTTATPATKHVPLPVKPPPPPAKPPVKQVAVPSAPATTPPATQTAAKPVTMFTPNQPAAAATVATTTAPAAAAPVTPAKPKCGGWINPCASNNGGGTSGGGSSVGPDSANRTSGGDGFAAGQGRFDYYDHSIVAYGCLRSGTRVFCDFDQFKQTPAQINAQSAFSGTKLVMSGGRIFSTARSVFVDTDGSTYPTAQMSPTTAVRLMLEYDDVPDTQNVAILSFNNKEIQNVAITPMNLQANGNPAPRSAAGGQQTATAPAAGQAGTAPAPQGMADRANGAISKAQGAKATAGSIFSGLKSLGQKPQ